MIDQISKQKIIETLKAKQGVFEKEREELRNTPVTVDLERDDRDTFMSVQEERERKDRELKDKIQTIEAVLVEAETNGFCVCVDCGKDIPVAEIQTRLESDLFRTDCCVECRKKRNHGTNHNNHNTRHR